MTALRKVDRIIIEPVAAKWDLTEVVAWESARGRV
jgi:hypothetical protein